MRKTYTSPSVVVSGTLISSTQAPASASSNVDGQPFQKDSSLGTVGFGL